MIAFLAIEEKGGAAIEPPAGWVRAKADFVTVWHPPTTPLSSYPGGPMLLIGDLFERGGGKVDALSSAHVNAIVASKARHLIEGYWGRYALFWRDPSTGILCVARDPSGAVPVYFERRDGVMCFFSDPGCATRPSRVRPIDATGLAHHLWFGGLPTRRTGLAGVTELLPGEMIRVGASVEHLSLWSPWAFATGTSQPGAARSVMNAVEGAVRALAAGRSSVLLELSGGLDSSIIAACLAGTSTAWRAATFWTPAADGDERRYARAVADAAGIALDEIGLGPANVDLLAAPRDPAVRPSGFGMLAALDHALARVATHHRADAVMSGTGGDNAFCSLRSAAPALDAWRRAGARAAVRATGNISRLTRTPALTILASACRYAARDRLWPNRWRTEPLFLQKDSRPQLESHPWLDRPKGGLPGARAHIASILRAQAVTSGVERARTHDVIFPLLSQPVLEACLAVPSFEWFGGGRDRAVARDAFADRLPPEISRRRTKGRLTSLLAPAYDRDRARMGELLADGILVHMGLIDRDAVARAVVQPSLIDERPSVRVMELVDAELWARAVTGRA